FQIPTEIRPKRKLVTGMKGIIKFARQRNGKSFSEKLAAEWLAAAKGQGAAVKRKDETHRMAERNRALAHFRVWSRNKDENVVIRRAQSWPKKIYSTPAI